MNEEALLKQYVNICNAILSRQPESSLIKRIPTLIKNIHAQESIAITVVDDSDHPLGEFSTRFADGQFTPITRGQLNPDNCLIIRRSYIENVLDNVDYYLEHPTKLDWDWIKGEVKAL